MALTDRIDPTYRRPRCPECGQWTQFIHENPGGSRYACLPCEFGEDNPDADWLQPGDPDAPMGAHEASWIIRNAPVYDLKGPTNGT